MRKLKILDKHNYERGLPRHVREAVRAVLLRDGKLLMVRSERHGYYKFPGGGIEAGETHEETLIRETKEETGARVIAGTMKELGFVKELRRDLFCREIFEQISYYYYAAVDRQSDEPSLIGYEKEEGFVPAWVTPQEALTENRRLYAEKRFRAEFLKRENYVLSLLVREEASKNEQTEENGKIFLDRKCKE